MTATTGEPIVERVQRRPTRLPLAWYAAAAIAPLFLLAAWGLVLLARPAAPSLARIGEPAPAFVVADLDGNPLRLEDLRGRPVIVNFWASWCGPCVEEFPLLLNASTAHREDGLAVIGIVLRDRSEAARAFMARMGATWPAAMDPGEAVATRYGIIGPPDTFFIDRNGIVVGRQIGQLSAADLERGLSQILGEE
ncbi:MAG: TlpA family protein disulfide reductase [Chloroflexota bacterium]|nr:TlpA family protein disulfide reductase [Chloroflexota bacterium]